MRFPLFERHPRQELSGYLDNELAFQRVEAVKAHLGSCPTCRAELDALRILKSQLAALPESPAPRSFALTPQMAQRPAPEPARARTPARVAALSNGMRLAGAGMAAALAVVMVLNFSGSSSDDSRKAVTAPEALIANSTTQDSDAADGDTSGSLAIPSVIATGTADSRASTAVPPDATATRGTAEGSVGGVPSVAADGFDGGGGSLAPGATSQTIPQTGEGGSEVVPSVPPPAATGLIDKNEAGSPRVNATEAPVIRSWQTDQAAPEAAPAAAQSDGGGVDILVLVAIVLAAGVVLAFAGSVLIPRIARDDQ